MAPAQLLYLQETLSLPTDGGNAECSLIRSELEHFVGDKDSDSGKLSIVYCHGKRYAHSGKHCSSALKPEWM